MADVLYALMMTQGELTSSFHFGYDYDRKQNAFHNADIRILIREIAIEEFEKLSGLKLTMPPKISGAAEIGGCNAR